MKNSIETIWREGFLNETSLVAPKINDLYNQKSKHVIEKMKKTFGINQTIIIILAVVIPVTHYFIDAIWQGIAASVLMLLTAWYGKLQMQSLKTLDQGTTSLDFLKSFDQWLKEVFSRSKKVARIYYTLCFVIAMSTIGSAWSGSDELVAATHRNFPGLVLIGNIPLIVLIIMGATTILMFYFSDKIYAWDVRLMYGRVFEKLEETIAEMEKLKEE